MTKEESKILKGVAILLMLYYHLFFQSDNANLCRCFLYVNGMPLIKLLTRACNPVVFFLILSGYGLYIVENASRVYDITKKIGILYVHYWISLLIFIPLCAYFIGTNKYPGTWESIVSNITAWKTTWNASIWFLFPYILLALSSRWIFRLMNKVNIWLFMLFALFCTYMSQFCISRYGEVYFYDNQMAYMPILYLDCLFAFVAGAWMAKCNIVERVKIKVESSGINKQWLWLLLILLAAFRCCFNTGALHSFYAIVFVILFVNAPRWSCVDEFLAEMGKRSTSIWFVHMYFCGYLFHDIIYGFRYPCVIFLVLLFFCYLSAIVIDCINKKIQLLLRRLN